MFFGLCMTTFVMYKLQQILIIRGSLGYLTQLSKACFHQSSLKWLCIEWTSLMVV